MPDRQVVAKELAEIFKIIAHPDRIRIIEELGRGEKDGVSNIKELSDSTASKSLEVLKQISSSGYLRKRLPQELVVFQGGQATAGTGSSTNLGAAAAEPVAAPLSETGTATAQPMVGLRAQAKMQGYEGEACSDCGNYTLVRNGTCMKCNTCGGTSGCS